METSCPNDWTLYAYLDNELESLDHATVAAHAMVCTRCAEWLERRRDIDERITRYVRKKMGLDDPGPA